MPQTKGKHDLHDEWINMLMSNHTSKEQVKEIQIQYMHKLGNLTLTGYNSELSAKPFLEKRDKKDSNGKFVGFKNGLSLNQDVADKNQWTSKEIDERTERLVREIIELFTLDV